MSDLIDIQDVIDLLLMNREEEYKKSLSAECEHKSVIRSKHDAHVAFCDYLIECVKQLPTHPTPSNTLDALDCVERQAAMKIRFSSGFDNDGILFIPYRDVEEHLKNLPSVQPERMVLPEICILEGYDTVEDENGNKGFGVYIPSKKQIYVVGDVPQEIMLKALFHELTHWVQDISGRHFDEDEANLFAERVYETLPHDMRGEQDE